MYVYVFVRDYVSIDVQSFGQVALGERELWMCVCVCVFVRDYVMNYVVVYI